MSAHPFDAPPAGHGSALQAVRAVAFIVIIYVMLLCMGLIGLPSAAVSRRAALGWVKRYCRWTFWLLRVMCGTRTEIRGRVPSGPCIVASKHQSFLDVMMLAEALPRPRFVMKRSLLWVPVIGYFARRIGCVAIDRQARGKAISGMLAGIAAGDEGAGDAEQVVIFPQGTRVAPGARVAYRGGVVRLHEAFGFPVVPAAVNTGWFWPRVGTRRSPGTAVVEFLEPLAADAPAETLLARTESAIESASDRLAAEAAAGFAARRRVGR